MKQQENQNGFLKIIATLLGIIFHPLFLPFYTVVLYFYVSPRFFLKQNIYPLEFYLIIVSILIPLLFLITLKYAGVFSGFVLKLPKERLFFSVIMLSVYFIIIKKMMSFHIFIELMPFFIGIFLALLCLAVYNFYNRKPSLHAMGFGGVLGFFLIWGYYSQLSIFWLLVTLILTGTIVIASRIYLQAHSLKEIFKGLIIGLVMQFVSFVVMYYWG